jgi:hypothetical protein
MPGRVDTGIRVATGTFFWRTHLHTCSSCQAVFETTTNRPQDISWRSLITGLAELFPLGKDIGSFELVKCPKCGHVEKSEELRIFGLIPGSNTNIKLVLFVFLLVLLLFGYWLLRVFLPASR